ncbi:MAG: molybdopterin-dependent oxidoreductase, partial [Deltaproteobacteria bacterium]|nr:molybdopterin-dependent oxidoreductase [Deltaproteobacteria bacterium]
IDPMEFRLINSNEPGEVTPQRFRVTSCGLRECIEQVGARLEWKKRKGERREDGRGVGMASLIHVGGGARVYKSDGCGTIIKVDDFGTVNVFTGATDIGQGAETVIAQMVAEEIGVLAEDVNLTDNDTDSCPWDVGVHASRTTFVAGNSALMAARKVREKILEIAAGYVDRWKDEEGNRHEVRLDPDPRNLVIKDRMVYSTKEPDKKIPLAKILRGAHYSRGGTMIMAESFYDPDNENLDREFKGNLSMTYAYGTHGVEVEVDRETGKVRILKYIAAHDVGRAINPMLLEGQIYGAAAMGTGYALTERLILEKGRVMNPNFRDYKILTAKDVIPVEPVIVESVDPEGPYGAKGIGEPGCVPSAPAIANAIYDAIGVRVKDLPITPEKILRALMEKEGKGS